MQLDLVLHHQRLQVQRLLQGQVLARGCLLQPRAHPPPALRLVRRGVQAGGGGHHGAVHAARQQGNYVGDLELR